MPRRVPPNEPPPMPAPDAPEARSVEPVGWVRSPYVRRHGTPQQASAIGSDAEARLELLASRWADEDLAALAAAERIWVVSWLDRGGNFSATVVPPRGPRIARGLLSTRSPDRPNPLGLSCLAVVRVEGHVVHVRGIDLLDGTPVLAAWPYQPERHAFPDARAGWIDAIPIDAPQRPKRDLEPPR